MLGRSTGIGLMRVFCLWVVFCVLPLSVHAQYGGGDGTAERPYLIFTAEHLNAVGANPDDWDKHFKLMADIDLAGHTASEFVTIGNYDVPFSGVFDGNCRTISNLRQVGEYLDCPGLFGIVDGWQARVENLTLADPNVVNGLGRYVGALIGQLVEATVSNCHVRAGKIQGDSFVGGMIGRSNGGNILDCTAQVLVRGASSRVGGLIGQASWGAVERCCVNGEILGDEACFWVGGLIGESRDARVTACEACCTVQGDVSIGGLIGLGLTSTIDRCRAAGVVKGGGNVGGLVGYNGGGTLRDCYATASVEAGIYGGGLLGCNGPSCDCESYVIGYVLRCYATGSVRGGNCGGLVAVGHRSLTENSFWDIQTTGCAQSAEGEGRNTLEMGLRNTYLAAGWDFDGDPATGTQAIWYLPDGGAYPRLVWELVEWDFNADGRIDFYDYSRLAARWRQEDTAAPVDFDDLMSFTCLWLSGRR